MSDSLKLQFGNIVQSYLGPCKSNKFVLDEEVSLIKCPALLLQKIKLKGSMTYIIEDALNMHHHQYNCSTTSFLAMWYFWYEEFQNALSEGCLLNDIIEHAQDILEEIISHLPEITIECNSLFDQEQKASKFLPQFYKHSKANQTKPSHTVQKQNSKPSEVSNHDVPIGIRYSSRHYSPSLHYLETEKQLNSENRNHLILMNESLRQAMYNAVHKLSHGDSELTILLSEIWIKQVTFSNCKRFNIKGINICPITLPCSYSTVVDGLIIKSTLSALHYQELVRHRENRALIVKSVAFEYVPLGCLKVSSTNKITAEELKVSEKALWVKKCCDVLLKLQVNLLLVNGEVDSDIQSFCSTETILVLPNIRWNTFAILSEFLNEPPCTCLFDCDSENVLLNVAVERWNFGDKIQNKEEYLRIQIKDTSDKQLLTVVLCQPNCYALNSLEHQFWHDAFRLHHATTENKCIPGCGKTEEWCFNKLQMSSCKKNSRVKAAVAQGFKTYFENVSSKSTQELKETLDELSSKTQAWRSAMALSLILLQIDKVIVTGLGNATEDLRNEEIIGVL